jgi:HD-like signal output (HDOD) protein
MGIKKQDIVNMVDKMPAFPKSVHRVLELSSDINCNPRDLVEVIEHDPVMVLKILQLVNSVYFGLSQKISSVNHAVVYIGLNTVKNLAVSAATVGALPRRNEAGFDMDAFLLHSLSTATIARQFARKMRVPDRESFDFFLSGLLHDFGKIVFAHFLPNEYRQALDMAKEKQMPLYMAESEVFDIDHAQVGSFLGEKWQLPSNLVESLKGHHTASSDSSLLINTVSAADQITKELKLGNSGENIVEKVPEEIAKLFGRDTGAIITALGDVQAEIEKARIFIKL